MFAKWLKAAGGRAKEEGTHSVIFHVVSSSVSLTLVGQLVSSSAF